MKDFNFQLFGVVRGSTLRFDGFPSLYLVFHSNLSGRGVQKELKILPRSLLTRNHVFIVIGGVFSFGWILVQPTQ